MVSLRIWIRPRGTCLKGSFLRVLACALGLFPVGPFGFVAEPFESVPDLARFPLLAVLTHKGHEHGFSISQGVSPVVDHEVLWEHVRLDHGGNLGHVVARSNDGTLPQCRALRRARTKLYWAAGRKSLGSRRSSSSGRILRSAKSLGMSDWFVAWEAMSRASCI